ncbi:MAG: hypothetical protein SVT56_06130 [Chloroflexota bacterium]|nr:hypothetical protein [Chloroflexota bacterium]
MKEFADPILFYRNLCREVTDELCLNMLNYMIENGCIGFNNRVSRAHLASALLGKANATNDRKIRKAKALLIEKMGVPIMSSSGSKGYYLAEYQDQIDGLITENNTRIASLMAQNRAINRIKLPYNHPSHTKRSQSTFLSRSSSS